jgi:hypothetical protein
MAPSSSVTISPEMRLLVYCAHRAVPSGFAKQIRGLIAAAPINWEELRLKAAENALTPLLERQLRAAAPDLLAAPQMKPLCEENHANTLRCLALVAELIQILDRLQEQGIAALPYKGPVLAAQAYGNVALRQFDDLDIVLRQRDMAGAHDAILGLGYAARFPVALSPRQDGCPIPGEYKYYNEARDSIVEFHTESTLRHFPVPPNLDDFFERSVTVDLSGHPARTFSPEDTLTAICIHGSKDFWGRISWIADVAELVRSHPGLDWDEVVQRAESLSAQRMLHLGLILAAGLLDAPLPQSITVRLKKDKAAQAAAAKLEGCLLRGDTAPMGAAKRFQFRRFSVPGFVAGWRYAARLTIAPADDDWAAVSLPRPLAPLYVLLRPLRLLQKYGHIGDGSPESPK